MDTSQTASLLGFIETGSLADSFIDGPIDIDMDILAGLINDRITHTMRQFKNVTMKTIGQLTEMKRHGGPMEEIRAVKLSVTGTSIGPDGIGLVFEWYVSIHSDIVQVTYEADSKRYRSIRFLQPDELVTCVQHDGYGNVYVLYVIVKAITDFAKQYERAVHFQAQTAKALASHLSVESDRIGQLFASHPLPYTT